MDTESEITCLVCYDDITEETKTLYKRYDNKNDTDYVESRCCTVCLKHMLDISWDNYVKQIKNADCEAQMKRLLEHGPPINLRCINILSSDSENKIDPKEEFESFYFDNDIQSAKLKGSLIGEEREKWIHEQQQVLEYLKSTENHELSTTN